MLKDRSRNICEYPTCSFRTTPEGYLCRQHWSYIPGALKSAAQQIRINLVTAVRAAEIIRPVDELGDNDE